MTLQKKTAHHSLVVWRRSLVVTTPALCTGFNSPLAAIQYGRVDVTIALGLTQAM